MMDVASRLRALCSCTECGSGSPLLLVRVTAAQSVARVVR
jgi:hypothetical protein